MAIEVNTETFNEEVVQSNKLVVIDFYAEWCGPCRQMSPHFEALSTELQDTCKLVKVNIDNERDLAIKHSISSIPTLIFYKNGTQVGTESGYMEKNQLKTVIERFLT